MGSPSPLRFPTYLWAGNPGGGRDMWGGESPSYQDISDYGKEVECGSEWKVEGGRRGTSKGRVTLGGYLDITRGVNIGKNTR